jgi:hypothetical protein
MSIDIRLIHGPDELQAVLQLRRRIYGQELGYALPPMPTGATLEPEALDFTGHLFGAFEGSRLVGAVRVNYGCTSGEPPADGFGPYADFYGMSRFGPAYPQGISIVTRLMAEARAPQRPDDGAIWRGAVRAHARHAAAGGLLRHRLRARAQAPVPAHRLPPDRPRAATPRRRRRTAPGLCRVPPRALRASGVASGCGVPTA